MKELQPADIGAFHQGLRDSLRDTPYNADRFLGLLKALLRQSSGERSRRRATPPA